MTGLLENLGSDRRIFPHQLNLLDDKVLLVQFDEAELRDHSFLDQRILRQGMSYEWSDWSDFETAAAKLPKKAPAYIFHVGHCGSTLLSRLVSAATGTQALREPLPLRTIAFDKADGRAAYLPADVLHACLGFFERAWARGLAQTVVKATSICGDLITLVNPAVAVVFVYQRAETHLAVTLAGENTLQDLRGFAQYRYRRLLQREIELQPLAAFTVGELAALSWLSEVLAAHAASATRSVASLDFDGFLQNPGDSLDQACRLLELQPDAQRLRDALQGPIMKTYSKAPEHAYGPDLRNEIIADSRHRNSREIARGMRWIEQLAAHNSEVAASINALSSVA